jgi:hypothetical protein
MLVRTKSAAETSFETYFDLLTASVDTKINLNTRNIQRITEQLVQRESEVLRSELSFEKNHTRTLLAEKDLLDKQKQKLEVKFQEYFSLAELVKAAHPLGKELVKEANTQLSFRQIDLFIQILKEGHQLLSASMTTDAEVQKYRCLADRAEGATFCCGFFGSVLRKGLSKQMIKITDYADPPCGKNPIMYYQV